MYRLIATHLGHGLFETRSMFYQQFLMPWVLAWRWNEELAKTKTNSTCRSSTKSCFHLILQQLIKIPFIFWRFLQICFAHLSTLWRLFIISGVIVYILHQVLLPKCLFFSYFGFDPFRINFFSSRFSMSVCWVKFCLGI